MSQAKINLLKLAAEGYKRGADEYRAAVTDYIADCMTKAKFFVAEAWYTKYPRHKEYTSTQSQFSETEDPEPTEKPDQTEQTEEPEQTEQTTRGVVKAKNLPRYYQTNYSDLDHGHLAIPPKRNAKPNDLVNPYAIAYLIPKIISLGLAADIAFETFDSHVDNPIGCCNSFPSNIPNYHRVEIAYHPDLDPAMVSTIPLSYKGEDYPPMSSTVEYIITRFVIAGFSFRMSTSLQRDLTGFCREIAERYNMEVA
ncbi:hypothetical protein BGX28_010503 [Mortierella sp. GBA30]|nr:hypothetical protein BGX28_010503 [Mortierella sp. GBA30]